MDIREQILNWSKKLYHQVQQVLPAHPVEADFRRVVDPLLTEFCAHLNLDPLVHHEYTYTQVNGRADAVFNRLVIEYERPGVLTKSLDKGGTRHAVEQVKTYLRGQAQKNRQTLERLAGVAYDGYYLVFVRYLNERWIVEPPVEANSHALARFLTWLAGLASGIALTAENLNRDFSIEQLRTQNVLREFYAALTPALADSESLVSHLFAQWRLFFSEAVDYSEAFGGRKLEPLTHWVRRAGLRITTPTEAERFFFVLHTYFALLAKLLAWLTLSRHLGVKLGAPAFGELASLDGETLRQRLSDLESGGIFRQYGILNLLEGDFFAWYLHAWNARVENALRELIARLDDYDPTTLSLLPEETRDLFKKLYHYLLPREVRHNLGEYYTPDWLAQRLLTQIAPDLMDTRPPRESLHLRQAVLNTRFLDPACGSGTFLVLILGRLIELGRVNMIPESDLLNALLHNVVGFDLNPLAVLTARVNYLLAIAELLEHRTGEITLPIYLADSVRTPAEGTNLFSYGAYRFPTAVGEFVVPACLCQPGCFDRFTAILEDSLHADQSPAAFLKRLAHALNLSTTTDEWNEYAQAKTRELYETMLSLHRRGLNGLWARLLKNNFAPLTVGQFDYIVGNPPWVNWEHLPDGYRQAIKPIWERYGLFPHGGMDAILGKGKKDIAMLMTYTVADNLLRRGGKLGFVITQSVFKTSGAGQGFRRFLIPKAAIVSSADEADPNGMDQRPIHLRVVHVDDMVALNPFEGASNRTAVMILEKGRPTRYPVPYTLWRKSRGARFTYSSTLDEVLKSTRRLNFAAEPVAADDPTAPWLTARPAALKAVRKILGRSDYEAHAGAYTGGANGVYWVEVVLQRPDGLVVVRNLTEGTKVKVDEVTEVIEPDLLYPLLRGRDVRRWRAEPSARILMVQDPIKRRGIDETDLQTHYPRTYAYLKRFEAVLRARAAFKRYFTRSERGGRVVETGPFYSMFDVGDYTFAPWKVVWPNIASSLEAAVISNHDGKLIIPQHIITLIGCTAEDEAHYLCALINSSCANFAAKAYSQRGGKSFGDPHILEHIRIPRYVPSHPLHRQLAELSQTAHAAAKAEDTARLAAIEDEIDHLAAQMWEITENELDEIRASLRELESEIEDEHAD
jgi:SAM-dependent methyltransferase